MRTKRMRLSVNRGARTSASTQGGNNTGERSKQPLFAYRPQSKRAGGGDDKPSWRDHFTPHPSAAVFNKYTTPEEQRKLQADIEKHQLQQPIVTASVPGDEKLYVVDGISRLDAMEKLGRQIVDHKGNWIGALEASGTGRSLVIHHPGYTHKQIADLVVSLNAKRRHMTQEDMADAIVEAVKAEAGKNFAPMQRSFSPTPGKRGGSTKDPIKTKAMKRATDHGISKHAVQRALAKVKKPTKPPTRKPKPVDKLQPEYVHKQFGMWLRRVWPSYDQHRTVRKIVHAFTAPQSASHHQQTTVT